MTMTMTPDFKTYSLALYRKDDLIYSSSGSGLRTLYEALEKHRGMSGLTLQDKVVGLAAARLVYYFESVERIFAGVASLPAREFLDGHGIRLTALDAVDNILTVDHSAVCPGERIALAANDPDDFMLRIKTFLGVQVKGLG